MNKKFAITVRGIEDRLVSAAKKEGRNLTPLELYVSIEAADPTKAKEYTPWLVKSYARGDIKLEDLNRNNVLADFNQLKKRRKIAPEHRDVSQYKSYRLFEDMFYENYSHLADVIEVSDKGEYEVFLDNDEVLIIIPLDETASCRYGRNTRWCTAATRGDNMFSQYNEKGPLYIVIPKTPTRKNEKYQLHFETESYVDEQDLGVSLSFLFKERFTKTALELLQVRVSQSWAYYWAKNIGDKEHMKQFVTEPARVYLWAKNIGDKEYMKQFVTEPVWAYYWAKDIGDKEHMRQFVTEPYWAYCWARDVGDREHMKQFVTDPERAYLWAKNIGDREHMKQFVTDPERAYLWAKNVGDKEYMKQFVTDSKWAYYWARDVGDKEYMKQFVTEPERAYYWALVIGDKEHMKQFVTESVWAYYWAKNIGDKEHMKQFVTNPEWAMKFEEL